MPKAPTKNDGKGNVAGLLPVKVPGGNKLADRLRNREPVLIGSPDYEDSDEHKTGNWSGLSKRIQRVEYLIKDWFPYGMVTGIVGPPKIGKSGLVLGGIAYPVVTGSDFFGMIPRYGRRSRVLWVDTENRAYVNMDRVDKWGFPKGWVLTPWQDELRSVDLDNPQDMERVYNVVCKYKTELLVVDSFRGSHKRDENNSKISESLRQLAIISEETKCGMSLVHHTRKLAFGEEMDINSARGSNAFLAAVACQLVIDQPDPKSDWRRLRMLGENLGAKPKPVGFRFGKAGLEFDEEAPVRVERQTLQGEIEAWLRKRMKIGQQYRAGEIETEATQRGYAIRTLRRVSTDRLSIEKTPVYENGKIRNWSWVLQAS